MRVARRRHDTLILRQLWLPLRAFGVAAIAGGVAAVVIATGDARWFPGTLLVGLGLCFLVLPGAHGLVVDSARRLVTVRTRSVVHPVHLQVSFAEIARVSVEALRIRAVGKRYQLALWLTTQRAIVLGDPTPRDLEPVRRELEERLFARHGGQPYRDA